MSEGNGNGHGNGRADGVPDPWGEEEPTPHEPIAIAEHADICSQLAMLSRTLKHVVGELNSIHRTFRLARTPIGAEILGDIADALEESLGSLQETVNMFREHAVKWAAEPAK